MFSENKNTKTIKMSYIRNNINETLSLEISEINILVWILLNASRPYGIEYEYESYWWALKVHGWFYTIKTANNADNPFLLLIWLKQGK